MMTLAMMTWKMMRRETKRIHLLVLLDHAGGIGVPMTACQQLQLYRQLERWKLGAETSWLMVRKHLHHSTG
jgi:hypothetical protein